MKVFIDFDDVIFNTKEFKKDFENLFASYGISEKIFKQYYYDPSDSRKIKIFDAAAHVKRIQDATGINTGTLLNEVNVFLEDVSQYVFSDVLPFVDSIGSEKICIVSFGGVDFLTKKIEGSGILKHIKNAKIIDYEKSKAITELLENEKIKEGEKIFFLDDRIEQICDVKEKFSRIVTILVKRPEGRYSDMKKENCCNHEAHNLKEAQEIISNLK